MGEVECAEFRFNASRHINVAIFRKTANDVLRKAVHRFYQSLPYFQHDMRFNGRRSNVIFFTFLSTIFHMPIFMKLTDAQWHYAQISCTEFYLIEPKINVKVRKQMKLIYVLNRSVVSTALFLRKFTITHQKYAEISCTQFGWNRPKNMGNTGRNLLTPVSKVWFSLHGYLWKFSSLNNISLRYSALSFTKIGRKMYKIDQNIIKPVSKLCLSLHSFSRN